MKDTCQCCYSIMDIQMPHFPNQLKTGSHNRSCVLLSVYLYPYLYLNAKTLKYCPKCFKKASKMHIKGANK